jgi:tetratricopeptide (TPR) repeat protein
MNNAEVENLEALQVTLQQNPDSLTFARVADALMKMGRLDEAVQICEEGVKRHPQYVTGHMVLGKCYMQKKLYEQAEKEFKRVLLYDPKYVAAHRYYGDLMREIGWENTCEMSYRKILHIDPLDDKVRGVVEEFARKAQAAKPVAPSAPAPPPAPVPAAKAPSQVKEIPKAPAPPSAGSGAPSVKRIPLDVDNLFEESDLSLPPSPAAPVPPGPPKMSEPARPVTSDRMVPQFDRPSPVSGEAKMPPLSKSDEARFSSILDDIFQDEVANDSQLYKRSDDTTVQRAEPRSEEDDLDRFAWKKTARQTKIKPEEKAEKKPPVQSEVEPLEPAARPQPSTSTRRREVKFDEAFEDEMADEQSWQAPEPPPKRPAENFAPVSEPLRPSPARVTEEFEEPAKPPVIPSEGGPRDRIVTPTLGEIYAAQGQYAKAIGVFELLSKKDPTNRHFREKIEYLKKRLQETQNAG